MGRSNSSSRHPSRPASRNAFDEGVDALGSAEAELAHLRHEGANLQGSSSQNLAASASYSYAAALGASLSRSTTPDPQHIARAPSPCPTPIGEGRGGAPKKSVSTMDSFNGMPSSGMGDSADLAAALSGMNLSANGTIDGESYLPSQIERDGSDHRNYLFGMQSSQEHGKQHSYIRKSESGHLHMPTARQSAVRGNIGGPDLRGPQVERPKSVVNSGVRYSKGLSPSSINGASLSPHYNPLDASGSSFANYGLTGFSSNSPMPSMMANQLGNFNLPPLLENVAASAMGASALDSRVLTGGLPSATNLTAAADSGCMGNQMAGNALQASLADAMYFQYLRSAEYAAHVAALGDQGPDKYYRDLLQKAYLGSAISPQKSQFAAPFGNKSSSNHGYYGNHAFGVGIGYPGSPLTSPVTTIGQGSPIRHNELNMRFPGIVRNLGGGLMGPWHMDGSYGSSLLEEFKSNKTKCFELSEIKGHVVEFRYVIFICSFGLSAKHEILIKYLL